MESPFSEALIAEFQRRFGATPQVAAQAPGRVNLIGEHTDYSGGLVLPCAIDRTTRVWAARRSSGKREDSHIRVWASDLGESAEFDPHSLQAEGGWVDYVKGVVSSLAEQGHAVASVDLAIASDLPRESGLSSSAALGTAVVTALDHCFGFGLGARERARLVHRSENEFVGTGCGILDQFASALGRRDHALRIDCRSEEVEAIAMPVGDVTLLVAHSGVTRRLARGDYRDRVAECHAATEALRDAGLLSRETEETLRDLPPEDLSRSETALEPTLFRRVRHVVTENRRVDEVCRDLRAGNLAAVGEALRAGQRSLREDFEVSTSELDTLCEIADALPGVWGSRLTGAGFGGCTLHLVESEAAPAVGQELRRAFEVRVGYAPPIWIMRPANGASVLEGV